jgi:hypothetical protein
MLNLLLVESGWDKPIRFFFVHFGYVPSGDALSAVRAKYRSVVFREINATVDDAVVIHLDKIALANFLVICDKAFAMRTNNLQYMAALDFSAVWVLYNIHSLTSSTVASAFYQALPQPKRDYLYDTRLDVKRQLNLILR